MSVYIFRQEATLDRALREDTAHRLVLVEYVEDQQETERISIITR